MDQNSNPLRNRLPLLVLLLLFAGFCLCSASAAENEFQAERVVAVGDLHGNFDVFVGLLRSAGIVDNRNRWRGGNAHLVQTGDMLDRGDDSRKIMDLLMELERQAPESGGMVHVLLGNHEAMNLYGDLRYVTKGEFDAFRGPDSRALRDNAYEQLADPAQKQDARYRSQWEDEHPLGWVEQRQAFGKDGKYGKWLRQKNVVIKINDILFVHGGISPKYVNLSMSEINDRARAELQDFTKLRDGMLMDPVGPTWYRALAESPEAELGPHVDAILQKYSVGHIVIAHTPTPSVVLPRFGGKVVMIDVGIGKVYGEARACLLVENGQLFALHRGSRLPLPLGSDTGAFMAYLKAAEFLEPADSHLRSFVRRMSAAGGAPK